MDNLNCYPVVGMKELMKIIKSLIWIVGVRTEIQAGGFILQEKLDISLVLEAGCTFRCNNYCSCPK
jgi:hypothetical protein